LRQSMQQAKKLSGIIYVHRIIEPRMQGTALSNMNMFRRLCGSDCFPNVVLATSFWSEVDPTEGAQRERELYETDKFWGQLVKKGSPVVRIGLDDRADERLLLRIAQNNKVFLRAQKEMQDGRRNCETSAAREANESLSDWRQYFNSQLEAEKESVRRELAEQHRRAEEQLGAQRIAFKKERQARKQAHEHYEADYAAMRRENENAVCQQVRLERLREALKLENERWEKLKQEQQIFYNIFKCGRTTKHRRIICNNCMSTIKPRRRPFYRK
jgi:hypothetical protein